MNREVGNEAKQEGMPGATPHPTQGMPKKRFDNINDIYDICIRMLRYFRVKIEIFFDQKVYVTGAFMNFQCDS